MVENTRMGTRILDTAVDQRATHLTSTAAPLTYAYLASNVYSGSTLVACLLGSHPAVATVGELGSQFPLVTYTCSCGQLVADCPFWVDWEKQARRQGIGWTPLERKLARVTFQEEPDWLARLCYYHFPWKALDRLRDYLYPARSFYRAKAAWAIDRSVQLASILCRMQGTTVFLDTTKDPTRYRYLAEHGAVRPKMIALVRDGRATMNSMMKNLGWSPAQAVRNWLGCNRHLERVIAHYVAPSDLYRLRYEDLCREPARVLAALCRFLEVDERVPADFWAGKSLHIVGNRMRHRFANDIRLDESWRQDLTGEQLAFFEAHAGRQNRHYGYVD
jgi:hypothetical protein